MSTTGNIMGDSVFWLAITTVTIGLIKYTIKICASRYKCDVISCFWGCFKSHRDTKAEVDIEQIRIEHGDTSDSNSNDEVKPSSPSRSF